MSRIRPVAHRMIRETKTLVDGKPLHISLEPGDMVGLKRKGDRSWVYIPIEDIWNAIHEKKKEAEFCQYPPAEIKRVTQEVKHVLDDAGKPLNVRQLEAEIRHGHRKPVNLHSLRAIVRLMHQQGIVEYVHPLQYGLSEQKGKKHGKRHSPVPGKAKKGKDHT